MQKNKLNNVIVLKNISSNIVEEAIIVLKPNVNLKHNENMNKISENKQLVNKNTTILKEAEYVIENCISQIQIKNKQEENLKLEKKYKFLKSSIIFLVIFNFVLLLKIF